MSRAKVVAAGFLVFLGAGNASAQEKRFSIELNDAIESGSGCRLVYVAHNGTGMPLDKTAFDVFTFDADGKVVQSLVFQFGSFRAGKTKVMQFDLPEHPCDRISRLLINEATECIVGGNTSTICLDMLATTTRTPIAFDW